jgi:hypothetical protein
MLLISFFFTTSSTNLSHKSTKCLQNPPSQFAHDHLLKEKTQNRSHKLNGENLLGKKNHLRDTKIHCIGQESFLASACVREAEAHNQKVQIPKERGEDWHRGRILEKLIKDNHFWTRFQVNKEALSTK